MCRLRQLLLRHREEWNFTYDATYVIAGGLGGIGRSIAQWMVVRGAKQQLLLSRSGNKSRGASKLCAELKALGATVHIPSCDISDSQALKAVLQHHQSVGPPIRGCVQGAMVLKASSSS